MPDSFQLVAFDSRRGNDEENEQEKILGFYPDSVTSEERISIAGLLQGLHTFSSSVGPKVNHNSTDSEDGLNGKFEIVETDGSLWASYEAEPGIFLAIIACKSWLPRHVSQSNLFNLLVHIHNLMRVLFCGIQYVLDKDESGRIVRTSIASVLKNSGDELTNASSWLNKELRNPLTSLGRAGHVSTSISTAAEVQSLCHRVQNVSFKEINLVDDCVFLFHRCVLWSTLADGRDTAALSALTHSSIFPQPSTTGALATLGINYSPSLTADQTSPSRWLRQMENGFYVLRNDEHDDESPLTNYALPFVYCGQVLRYLLAFGRGDALLVMLTNQSSLSTGALTSLQTVIESSVAPLLDRLALESQQQGGELGHVHGWRYSALDVQNCSVKASPRRKISAMTHHARALATAMSDSLHRIQCHYNTTVEVCAQSTQGIWSIAHLRPTGGKEVLIVKEKKADEIEAEKALINMERSLQSLGLL